MMLIKFRIVRLLACLAVLGFCDGTLVAQQESEPEGTESEGTESEGTEQYADLLPFPTDQITVPSWRYARGPHVKAAFREVVSEVSQAAVRVRAEGKKTAMGAVVGSDGWIVTKASRLRGAITCELADGRKLGARIAGVNRDYDVAMLKIEAQGLPSLEISDAEVPPVGSWLATVGLGRDPLAVGVVSVLPREIVHRAGILGVWLDDKAAKARIVGVIPKSAAERAGLHVNDVIATVDGVPTPNREKLIRTIQKYSPEDKVVLEVERGDETLVIEAMLMGGLPGRPQSREEFQNQLGGGLSQRRFGFPTAFQHDTVVVPSDCGGPIVNLDGEVVGFNIARSGRTESYAIPAASVSKLIGELMSEGASAEVPPVSEEK